MVNLNRKETSKKGKPKGQRSPARNSRKKRNNSPSPSPTRYRGSRKKRNNSPSPSPSPTRNQKGPARGSRKKRNNSPSPSPSPTRNQKGPARGSRKKRNNSPSPSPSPTRNQKGPARGSRKNRNNSPSPSPSPTRNQKGPARGSRKNRNNSPSPSPSPPRNQKSPARGSRKNRNNSPSPSPTRNHKSPARCLKNKRKDSPQAEQKAIKNDSSEKSRKEKCQRIQVNGKLMPRTYDPKPHERECSAGSNGRTLQKVCLSPQESTKTLKAFPSLSDCLKLMDLNLKNTKWNAAYCADPDPDPPSYSTSGCDPPPPPPPSDAPFTAADLEQFAEIREKMCKASGDNVSAMIDGSILTLDIIHPVPGLPNNAEILVELDFSDSFPLWRPINAANIGVRAVINNISKCTTGYVYVESFSFKYDITEDGYLQIRIPKDQFDNKERNEKKVSVTKFPLGEDNAKECAFSLSLVIDGRQMDIGFALPTADLDGEFIYSTQDFITIKAPLDGSFF